MINMELPSLIVLVRHAESTRNAEKKKANPDSLIHHPSSIINYKEDNKKSELTEKGTNEAIATGKALKEKFGDFDVMISSHYVRTDQTAKIIAKKLGITYSYDERLSERKKGKHDAYSIKGIKELFPEEYAIREKTTFYKYRPPEGESPDDVRKRTEEFVKEIFPKHNGKKMLIITHGANVILFRQVLEKLSDSEAEWLMNSPEFKVKNGSMTSYVSKNGKLKLDVFNSDP